jgi:hypothetical protein
MDIKKEDIKKKLVKEILQTIETLAPTEVKAVPESMVSNLYNLKKRIIELDPKWEFNDPYSDYVFRILILLDALRVDEAFDPEKHGKICHMIC